jgi:predicted enzyme related to lactoylglutathione lyase
MNERTWYPPGVPCWLDLVQPDHDRLTAFYGGLFGWTFELRTPPEAPVTYAYARRNGLTAAGVGSQPPGDAPEGWVTYVRVDVADATAAVVEAHGGTVVSPPTDIPGAGRVATCADPHGALIGLWEPAENQGVELVNAAGSWNFSELHTPDPDTSVAFYAAVFGWVCDRMEMGPGEAAWLFRLPGYGDHLAETNPEMRESLADPALASFADAVAWLEPFEAGAGRATSRWTVTFAVDDADAAVARALELGAAEVSPLVDTLYTRQGMVRDPQGAELTLSEYRPPQQG